MKLKAIALAVAASSLMSGAYALSPAVTATIPASQQFILAGASAQDKAVLSHIVGDLCAAGSIDVYANAGLVADPVAPATTPPANYVGGNDTSVSCNSAVAFTGIPAGTPVLFRKLSGGGSVNGINAVGNAVAPANLYATISATNCPTALTPWSNYLKTGKVATGYNCNGGVAGVALVPGVGFADVDPQTLVGTVPVNLVNKTSFVLTYGVQVTKALRDVLQAAQFGTTGTGATRIGSDKLADMPSLSLSELASLYGAGGIKDWNQFTTTFGNTPSFGTLSQVAAQAGLQAPANTRVQVVRRVAGSGTQATLQSLILGNPCNGDFALNPAGDNTPATTTSGTGNYLALPAGGVAAVHEESSAGNTVLALEALSAAKEWAIGFNSMEIGSTNTRFLKVEGAEPTVQQVAGNAYPLWAENQITINAANDVSKGAPANIYNDFFTTFKSGVALSELNSEFDPRITEVTAAIANTCGVGEQCVGYLNPAVASDTSTFTNANPTATATRGLGAAAPSMCRPATVIRTTVVEDGTFTTP